MLGNEFFQLIIACLPYVEVAIGSQYNAVIAALYELVFGKAISSSDTRFTGC